MFQGGIAYIVNIIYIVNIVYIRKVRVIYKEIKGLLLKYAKAFRTSTYNTDIISFFYKALNAKSK